MVAAGQVRETTSNLSRSQLVKRDGSNYMLHLRSRSSHFCAGCAQAIPPFDKGD